MLRNENDTFNNDIGNNLCVALETVKERWAQGGKRKNNYNNCTVFEIIFSFSPTRCIMNNILSIFIFFYIQKKKLLDSRNFSTFGFR